MKVFYINDLPKSILVPTRLFADDCVISYEIDSEADCSTLQEQLNKIKVWCDNWGMELNSLKCEVVSFTNKIHPVICNYKIGDVVLSRNDHYQYLGITLHSSL